MAEIALAQNLGDLTLSLRERMPHPTGQAEGRQKQCEESDPLIVLRVRESRIHGEAKGQFPAT